MLSLCGPPLCLGRLATSAVPRADPVGLSGAPLLSRYGDVCRGRGASGKPPLATGDRVRKNPRLLYDICPESRRKLLLLCILLLLLVALFLLLQLLKFLLPSVLIFACKHLF